MRPTAFEEIMNRVGERASEEEVIGRIFQGERRVGEWKGRERGGKGEKEIKGIIPNPFSHHHKNRIQYPDPDQNIPLERRKMAQDRSLLLG